MKNDVKIKINTLSQRTRRGRVPGVNVDCEIECLYGGESCGQNGQKSEGRGKLLR